jgi:hypothetical protein
MQQEKLFDTGPGAQPKVKKPPLVRREKSGYKPTFYGQILSLPVYPGVTECECGQVSILPHRSGGFVLYDRSAPLGKATLGDGFRFKKIKTASDLLVKRGCTLHTEKHRDGKKKG